MTQYATPHEPWHDIFGLECTCDEAWSGRGLVDDRCYYHRCIDIFESVGMVEVPWCATEGHDAPMVYFDDARFEGGKRCLDADSHPCRLEEPARHWKTGEHTQG